MTNTNVYVAELPSADPDALDRLVKAGQPPARLGAFFPPSRRDPFFILLDRIRGRELSGQQIDWGAWAAVVTKQEIVAFIEDVYRDDETYLDPARAPHLFPKLAELERFVAALAGERYALVAIEL